MQNIFLKISFIAKIYQLNAVVYCIYCAIIFSISFYIEYLLIAYRVTHKFVLFEQNIYDKIKSIYTRLKC